MVVGVVCHLGNMPIAREEDEKFIRVAVVEASTSLVVIIMDYIGTVLAVRFACIVVDDAETLHALYHILEVDMMVVAFTASFFERLILAVFHAHGELGAWYRMSATRDGKQVVLGNEVKQSLPLLRILLIL